MQNFIYNHHTQTLRIKSKSIDIITIGAYHRFSCIKIRTGLGTRQSSSQTNPSRDDEDDAGRGYGDGGGGGGGHHRAQP